MQEKHINSSELGKTIAATFLKGAGFSIVDRNFRCVCGEVDIVARDGRSVVFVEVNCRKHGAFGPPHPAVTLCKRRQISRAALVWLSKRRLYDADARFDLVAIVVHEHDPPEIEHIRNAFDLAY